MSSTDQNQKSMKGRPPDGSVSAKLPERLIAEPLTLDSAGEKESPGLLRTAILVLGMHRSGTSALTRVINLLGADLPSNLMQSVKDNNESGFWESLDVFHLNDQILGSIDSRWDDWRPLVHDWCCSTAADKYKARALELLTRDFANSRLFVLKDPRICRLLPFWLQVLCEFEAEPKYIVSIRNPLEVSASLKRRDDFISAKSQVLWLRYVLDSEYGTRGANRSVITYDELLHDWRRVTAKLSSELGVSWPGLSATSEAEIDRFLEKRDRHYSIDDASVFNQLDITSWIQETYSAFSELQAHAESTVALNILDSVRAQLDQAGDALGPIFRAEEVAREALQAALSARDASIGDLQSQLGGWKAYCAELQTQAGKLQIRIGELESHVGELESHIGELQNDVASETQEKLAALGVKNRLLQHVNAIHNTYSWQLAHPFRFLERRLPRLMRGIAALPKLVLWTLTLRLPGRLRLRRQASELLETGLFNRPWYLSQNPDIVFGGINPVLHWLVIGWREGRDPNPLFDTSRYLAENPEVARANDIRPLLHYLAKGAADITNFEPLDIYRWQPESFTPLVTIIVPNYNHQQYLRKRLDSIYNQTYKNFRVILLDDCSTDNSRTLLTKYAKENPDKTKTIYNENNSGAVFKQWQRGIEASESELIWIAESDDYCDPNFLESIVPYFMDEAVNLAYCHSVFVDEHGNSTDFRFEDCVSELSEEKWLTNYVEAANKEVSAALGKKNTIPNVSSAVFRRADLGQIFADNEWSNMKICGDWIFYLHIARGGKVAYTVDTNNYYRFHTANSSVRTYVTAVYYKEHEAVAREMVRLYKVPPHTLTVHRSLVERFFTENGKQLQASGVTFCSLYDTQAIKRVERERKPNVLIVIYGFCTGGGEIFPIRLANGLKEAGYGVTLFNFKAEPTNAGVRTMLVPGIPVVERNSERMDIASFVEQFGIDVIHTHHASVDRFFATAKYGFPKDVKHIVTMHGMYEAMPQQEFESCLSDVRDAIDAWVYISDKNIASFKNAGTYNENRFFKIRNGMPRPRFVRLDRTEVGIPNGAFVLCLASRAIPEKGWREAIEIASAARRLGNLDIHLLLLGDGPVYEELRSSSLPAYVHLFGFVKDAIRYYALSDVGILPTTFAGESYPLSVIECLMTERPLLASDVGEIREMLTATDGEIAGFLIDISSGSVPVRETAEQLLQIAKDSSLYKKKQALAAQASLKFDMSAVVRRYGDVYNYVLGRPYYRGITVHHR